MVAADFQTTTTEFSIFGRILANGKTMSKDLASYVLTLGFAAADQVRMGELAERNQLGDLNAEEHEELMSYVRAGHLLALMHSQARMALKNSAK
jgi:hypothetical protein